MELCSFTARITAKAILGALGSNRIALQLPNWTDLGTAATWGVGFKVALLYSKTMPPWNWESLDGGRSL